MLSGNNKSMLILIYKILFLIMKTIIKNPCYLYSEDIYIYIYIYIYTHTHIYIYTEVSKLLDKKTMFQIKAFKYILFMSSTH